MSLCWFSTRIHAVSPIVVARSVDDSMSLNTIVIVPSKSCGNSCDVSRTDRATASIDVSRAPTG